MSNDIILETEDETKVITKIIIFGRPGSGKSTFAHEIHQVLALPLHHLDKYFYISNWIERDYEEFLAIQQNLINSEAWIIDGNCIRSLEMRYCRADIMLYFNYPKSLCIIRLIKRLLIKNNKIHDRAPGCDESISMKLIKYLWNFENKVKEQIKDLQKKYPDVKFLEITNDHDLNIIKDKLLGKA